mmetsp:Transcript_12682/g.38754  ORF Transcript_12682/g.38754 Transcript_12682/m.38754 type:complete len:232 (+) Transcript_12682:553-1248(+)
MPAELSPLAPAAGSRSSLTFVSREKLAIITCAKTRAASEPHSSGSMRADAIAPASEPRTLKWVATRPSSCDDDADAQTAPFARGQTAAAAVVSPAWLASSCNSSTCRPDEWGKKMCRPTSSTAAASAVTYSPTGAPVAPSIQRKPRHAIRRRVRRSSSSAMQPSWPEASEASSDTASARDPAPGDGSAESPSALVGRVSCFKPRQGSASAAGSSSSADAPSGMRVSASSSS